VAAPLERPLGPVEFDDNRLPELSRRFRARNWPSSLSKAEAHAWREQVLAKLENPDLVATTRVDFERQVARMAIEPDSAAMAQRLLLYRDRLYGLEETGA
ncbi:MAG: hypothetical protein ACPGSC_12360, partial [Granulosicoccaceae bacterium]